MKNACSFCCLAATLLMALPAELWATDTPATSGLPAMQFGSTIAGDEIYDVLKNTPIFSSLDKEKAGSPILIRVSHTYGHPSAGAGILSAIIAGGTLGLLPAISNRDLIVTYEILVNGSVLISHAYSKNVTHVFNIYAKDKTHGLGTDGLAWVTGTATQFATDASRDPKFADVQAEYHYYYDSPPVDPAR
jgi:hypothetical protein